MNIVNNENWLVIVNLHAGSKRCKHDWPEIEKLLNKSTLKTTIIFTKQQHDATEITSTYIGERGYNKIVVVGGDGTMNEVVNGIFQQKRIESSQVTLGLITVGIGNDWGRHYGMSSDYKSMIETIVKGITFVQDVGMVKYSNSEKNTNRYFVNIAGMGYDALVTKKTNVSKQNGRGGMFIYLINLLQGLFQYNSTQLSLTVDDKQVFNGKVFSLSIGICKYNGGGMMQLPYAISNDGLFDVTLIKKTSKFTVMRNIKNLYDGSFVNMKEVETFTGKEFVIEATPPSKLFLETDGESLGHSPLLFEIVPSSVKLIVRSEFLDAQEH